jgi:hypothetical protein
LKAPQKKDELKMNKKQTSRRVATIASHEAKGKQTTHKQKMSVIMSDLSQAKGKRK